MVTEKKRGALGALLCVNGRICIIYFRFLELFRFPIPTTSALISFRFFLPLPLLPLLPLLPQLLSGGKWN